MAKKNQPSSWESKRFQTPPKNDMAPVPEIQGKKKNK